MTLDLNALLADLHGKLASELLDRIVKGEATSADLNVARQMLKDNGIDAAPKRGNPLSKLAGQLPTFEDEDSPVGGTNH